MAETPTVDRRSSWNAFRVEQDVTRRQVVHLLVFTGVFVVGTTAAMCAHYFLLHHGARGTVPVSGSLLDELSFFWRQVPEFRLAMVSWILSMVGLSALFAVGLGAHFARTFAGPLHALKRDLELVATSGEARPVKLRDGDQLLDLAGSINRAVASVAAAHGARDEAAAEELEALRRDVALQLDRLDPATLPPVARERIEAWVCGVRDRLRK
jgi:hypothetical protein